MRNNKQKRSGKFKEKTTQVNCPKEIQRKQWKDCVIINLKTRQTQDLNWSKIFKESEYSFMHSLVRMAHVKWTMKMAFCEVVGIRTQI